MSDNNQPVVQSAIVLDSNNNRHEALATIIPLTAQMDEQNRSRNVSTGDSQNLTDTWKSYLIIEMEIICKLSLLALIIVSATQTKQAQAPGSRSPCGTRFWSLVVQVNYAWVVVGGRNDDRGQSFGHLFLQ
jgi:hypothetical protein